MLIVEGVDYARNKFYIELKDKFYEQHFNTGDENNLWVMTQLLTTRQAKKHIENYFYRHRVQLLNGEIALLTPFSGSVWRKYVPYKIE